MPTRNDRGSGTVLALFGLAVLLVTAVVIGSGIVLAESAHRAAGAADLAALAGARALSEGDEPCGAAARIADRNGARLVSCDQLDADVVVSVRVESPRLWGRSWDVPGRARAGPG